MADIWVPPARKRTICELKKESLEILFEFSAWKVGYFSRQCCILTASILNPNVVSNGYRNYLICGEMYENSSNDSNDSHHVLFFFG